MKPRSAGANMKTAAGIGTAEALVQFAYVTNGSSTIGRRTLPVLIVINPVKFRELQLVYI